MIDDPLRRRILYHLDYSQISLPQTLSLGLPIITQARLIVDGNLTQIEPEAEPIIIEIVERLDCILLEIDQARRALIVESSGGTTFRENAIVILRDEYNNWRAKLADTIAAQPNPVSNAAHTMWGSGGGVIEGC